MNRLLPSLSGLITIAALASPWSALAADITLLNVSYDPTRELYQEYNAAFAKYWQAKTGDKVTIKLRTAVPANRHAP